MARPDIDGYDAFAVGLQLEGRARARFGIEHDDALVALVGNPDLALGAHTDAQGVQELPVFPAHHAERGDSGAGCIEYRDLVIAAVDDVGLPAARDRDVGGHQQQVQMGCLVRRTRGQVRCENGGSEQETRCPECVNNSVTIHGTPGRYRLPLACASVAPVPGRP